MNNAIIKHAVWATGVPPVTTAYWAQEDWMAFEDGFRPDDFYGDRYDKQAWTEYLKAKNERVVAEMRDNRGWSPDPRSGEPLFGRTVHSDVKLAIREAMADVPKVVAHIPDGFGESTGWVVYDPKEPIKGLEPALLCLKPVALPIPLSETGRNILNAVLDDVVHSVRNLQTDSNADFAAPRP
ncbi:hypothetical protein [Thalassospira xiamenensis]|uniref:Uncharacterized protein n=1 Tax=Thalassospira xiamenensis TaxID=220697 RepID=A0A285TSP0_9PROT|nr:hypothetical protein [Thalassospira xiamenensis]SOC26941.1 hypothetical protein SAMN05428964_105237 [Thalassospira xiamenensis]